MYPLAESTVLPATSLPSAVARATSTSGASAASKRYASATNPSRTTTAMPPKIKRRDHAGGSPPPSRREWSMRRLRKSSCLLSVCPVSVGIGDSTLPVVSWFKMKPEQLYFLTQTLKGVQFPVETRLAASLPTARRGKPPDSLGSQRRQ